jgi:flagellar motor component MotA
VIPAAVSIVALLLMIVGFTYSYGLLEPWFKRLTEQQQDRYTTFAIVFWAGVLLLILERAYYLIGAFA